MHNLHDALTSPIGKIVASLFGLVFGLLTYIWNRTDGHVQENSKGYSQLITVTSLNANNIAIQAKSIDALNSKIDRSIDRQKEMYELMIKWDRELIEAGIYRSRGRR